MPKTLQPLPLPISGPSTAASAQPSPAKKRSGWRTLLWIVLGLIALLLLAAVVGAASLATYVMQQVADGTAGSDGVRVIVNGQPWHGWGAWGDDVLPGGWLGTLVTGLVGAVLAVVLVALVAAVVVGVVGFVAVPLLAVGAAVVLAVVLAVLVAVFGSGLAVALTAAVVLAPVWLVGWLLWRLVRRARPAAPTARMAA
jgi:nitrate reductase NapE component